MRRLTPELLDLHTSWDTWERLRTWQGLSADRAKQLVSALITQALTHRSSWLARLTDRSYRPDIQDTLGVSDLVIGVITVGADGECNP